MSKSAIVLVVVFVVVFLLVAARVGRAQGLPRFRAADAADEERLGRYVDAFFANDPQARQLLNRSNTLLFSEGHRPKIGVPHDPETPGKKSADLRAYFVRKLYLDLRSLEPFNQPKFRAFVDQIGRAADETIICVGELSEKHKLNVAGRFVFETEIAKVPERERHVLKQCWINDAVLSTELRMLAWIHGELFGKPYATPESRGAV